MVQGGSTSHMRSLLTIVGHIEGDPALGMKGPGLVKAVLDREPCLTFCFVAVMVSP